ncbi:glycerophosphodiester phosphodiesterase family protein [Chthonobacter rhizosphaerae]|uniref:glycerophosphodiester phosphodiesterase family protein n=1 Tax=Chthonobacter rhizosphaerae TaxID=2735553 RepID=UPI0015EF464C|nr:glycerophosphodiester phosphodiesterase family protein [Chthonobacter rhizosphaerae]
MPTLDWLTARPVAHRGFHDASAGRLENTLSAIGAAVDAGFAIEIDVHLSADGRVFVFHDDTLDRLTTGTGPVGGMTLDALQAVPFRATPDRIPSLEDVLDRVAGRVPLIVEVKSHFDGRHGPLTDAVARALSAHEGPVAAMSFDPRIVAGLRATAPDLPRGIVADDAEDKEYGALRPEERTALATLAHRDETDPHFVAYWVKLLPNSVSRRVREDWRLPLLTWTVRTSTDRAAAAAHADQMIFEGFDPR